jgi:hypothetical protein
MIKALCLGALAAIFQKLIFETPFFLLPLPSSKIVIRDSSKEKKKALQKTLFATKARSHKEK